DGHGSHIQDEIKDLAMENNIELFALPAHMSHKLQPLNVGVFGPMQKAWSNQCNDYAQRTHEGMQHHHVVHEYMAACKTAFT
ncbi:hypothetical protein WOLCODRAFT_37851, partial [Wolfiporia cocos MD-104 SS10]